MEKSEFNCYHTQEKRRMKLNAPIKCTRKDAWLGNGFYFWYSYEDSVLWGMKSKRNTGRYEIYKGLVKNESILDTVFNEEQYNFWVRQIEKAALVIFKMTSFPPKIKEINEYFSDHKIFKEIKGILFQDLPMNETNLVQGLYYKKRIQLVLFTLDNLLEFEFLEQGDC